MYGMQFALWSEIMMSNLYERVKLITSKFARRT